ncbi:DinB family protein [Planococcus sp. YIM B11945]|uniref:DinB family protein n=1 Tax=Planococcus sp. YIM B11945 TaxID=3435410 RepID=UPI003D7D0E11
MYRTMEDFLAHWREESAMMQQVLDGLTDESLSQQVTADHRTLGRLGWHLTTTLAEVAGHAGLTFEGTKSDAPMPSSAQEIADAYRTSNEAMIKAFEEQWTDETLKEERDMYGEQWTVAQVLTMLVSHQIHHRGQMIVLMRQAGLRVPGLYGPTKEDWATFGETAPTV